MPGPNGDRAGQHVDPSEALQSLADHRGGRLWTGDVAEDLEHVCAVGLAGSRGLLQRSAIGASGDDQLRALGSECRGNGAADVAAGTGDQRHASCQSHAPDRQQRRAEAAYVGNVFHAQHLVDQVGGRALRP